MRPLRLDRSLAPSAPGVRGTGGREREEERRFEEKGESKGPYTYREALASTNRIWTEYGYAVVYPGPSPWALICSQGVGIGGW